MTTSRSTDVWGPSMEEVLERLWNFRAELRAEWTLEAARAASGAVRRTIDVRTPMTKMFDLLYMRVFYGIHAPHDSLSHGLMADRIPHDVLQRMKELNAEYQSKGTFESTPISAILTDNEKSFLFGSDPHDTAVFDARNPSVSTWAFTLAGFQETSQIDKETRMLALSFLLQTGLLVGLDRHLEPIRESIPSHPWIIPKDIQPWVLRFFSVSMSDVLVKK